jgi:hypothetical protein
MAVGTWDVNGMLRSMSGKQFLEWLAFSGLEPFGPERDDQRSGAIIQVLMNAHRNTKKRSRPYTLADATPIFGDAKKPTRVADWRAMKAVAIMMTADSRARTPRGRKRVT